MSPRLAHCGRGPGGWLEAVLHCGRDVLWGQGVIGAKGWGKGAPGMDALVECESSSGPVVKSSLRAPGANRGAGSVIGLRGGAGRARGHPNIRKPAPILPHPRLPGHRTAALTTLRSFLRAHARNATGQDTV